MKSKTTKNQAKRNTGTNQVPRYELAVNRFENIEECEGIDLIRLGFEDTLQRVKVFEKECPSHNYIMVYDIKINGFDDREDFLYADHPDLQLNLRKGHTIVEIYDPENFNTKIATITARKGQQKYYSIRSEDLEDDESYFAKQDFESIKNQKEYEEAVKNLGLRNYTLSPVFHSFQNNCAVEIYCSTYVIGENTQISWIDSENIWVIASKHCSIFIKSEKDLESYNASPDSVNYIPCMIAEYWLKFFNENIKDKITFQKSINGKTLCASYINNSLFDSLLKYEKPVLIFNSIVENKSSNVTCLTPGVCYRFFNKWGLTSAPVNKIGTYNEYSHLIRELKSLHNKISNSSIHDEELGNVVYFVEKGEPDRVISMGKFETKQSVAFLSLINILREFWKKNEEMTAWSKSLNSQYKASFERYEQLLKNLDIKDFDFYNEVASFAFNKLKEDLDLYYKLKTDSLGFLLDVTKSSKDDEIFTSTALNRLSDDISTQSLASSRKSSSLYDDAHVPRSEDAIDRLMKNEYIRRHSNIKNDEEDRLEDIICSEISIPTPTKERSAKKKATGRRSVKTTIKKMETKESIPEASETKNLNTKIYSVKLNTHTSVFEPKVKRQSELIIKSSAFVDARLDKAQWFLDYSECNVSDQDIYNAFVVESENAQNQLHLLPSVLKTGDKSQRVYKTYYPFGLKKQRCHCIIKNTILNKAESLNGILYEDKLDEDIITHSFNEEVCWRFLRNMSRRSFKLNLWLYYSNMSHWFAQFRILASYIKSIYNNFKDSTYSIVYPSNTHLYSPGLAVHVFSSLSFTTVPLFNLISKQGKEFLSLLQTFLHRPKARKNSTSKSKSTSFIDQISSFISECPAFFISGSKPASNRKLKQSNSKKVKKAKQVDATSEVPSDEFCKLFAEQEKELAKAVEEKAQAKGKAFVIAKRPNEEDKNNKQKKDKTDKDKVIKKNKDKEKKDKEEREKIKREKEAQDLKDKLHREQELNRRKQEQENNERLLRERLEKEKREKEQKEKEKLDREQKEKENSEREQKEKEQKEREQQEKEQREREQQEKEQLEREQQEKEQREREQKEKEQLEREQQEKEQREREQQEKEQREREQQEKEQREREQHEKEQREREQQEKEQREREEQEKEQREREQQEKEQREREEQEKEQREREQQEKEQREREQQEKEQREREQQEKEQREREQQEKEQREKEQQEKEQREREQQEREQREREQQEREQREREQQEKEQLEREQQEREQREREQQEREQREREQQEKEQREREQQEKEQREREQQEHEQREREQQEREQREREQQEREQREKEQQEREQREREQQEREQREREQQEKEQLEKEQQEREQREREQQEREQREREQQEKEQREREQQEKEQREREQQEREQREREQQEREQQEREQQEREQREKEQQEKEQHERELLEREHKEKEQRDKEQKDKELEDQRILKEQQDKALEEQRQLEESKERERQVQLEAQRVEEANRKEEQERLQKEKELKENQAKEQSNTQEDEKQRKLEIKRQRQLEAKKKKKESKKQEREAKEQQETASKVAQEQELKPQVEDEVVESSQQEADQMIAVENEQIVNTEAPVSQAILEETNVIDQPAKDIENDQNIEVSQEEISEEVIQQVEIIDVKKGETNLTSADEEPEQHHVELIEETEIHKNEEDEKKIEEIEENQKEDHIEVTKDTEEYKPQEDEKKLEDIEEHQKEDHIEVTKDTEEHKPQEDEKKLEDIEEHQKEDHIEVTKDTEEHKPQEDEKKLEEIEEHQKEFHKQLTHEIEELKHQEDESKLQEIEQAQKDHHKELTHEIEELKHQEDERKLQEIEQAQKDHHKELTHEIEEQKHQEDERKLQEIEQAQKEHHKLLTNEIEECKHKEDEAKLEKIEQEQKEYHKQITNEIEDHKLQEDIKKLDEIENLQKEHHIQIRKAIEEHKHLDDLHKLEEIENTQKLHNDAVLQQILENKKNSDQKRLEKIESDQKEHAESVFKEINELKRQADQRKLEEIERQQKEELTNVVHEIQELPESEEIEVIGSPTKSEEVPISEGFKIQPNETEEEKIEINESLEVSNEEIKREEEEEKSSPFSKSKDLEEEKSPFGGSMRRKRVERVTKSSSVFEKVKTPIARNKQKEAVPKIKKTESAKLRSSLTKTNPTTSKFAKEKSPYYSGPKPIAQSVSKSLISIKDIHYLGLKLNDIPDVNTEKLLNDQVSYCLKRLIDKEPLEILTNMQKALESGGLDQLGWTLPPMPFHITSTIINGKSTVSNKKSIEEFKIGVEEKIEIRCIIIVEDLFIVGLCSPKLVSISGKIPHMALWINGAKPKDFNTILEYILYKIKPTMLYGEEKLRTYYAIINKSILKDDIVGEVKINLEPYKARRVWYCFIKDSVKLGFESFIKNMKDDA